MHDARRTNLTISRDNDLLRPPDSIHAITERSHDLTILRHNDLHTREDLRLRLKKQKTEQHLQGHQARAASPAKKKRTADVHHGRFRIEEATSSAHRRDTRTAKAATQRTQPPRAHEETKGRKDERTKGTHEDANTSALAPATALAHFFLFCFRTRHHSYIHSLIHSLTHSLTRAHMHTLIRSVCFAVCTAMWGTSDAACTF